MPKGGSMGPPLLPNNPRRSDRIASRPQQTTPPAAGSNGQQSSSHSSRHRRRSDITPSFPSSGSQRPPTTEFSASTRRDIRRDGEDCWHCRSNEFLEHSHLVGRSRQHILDHLKAQGKTNVEWLHQKENGIYLCVFCHRALDDHEDPGWVFVPTNLEYFLEAERRDFVRRTAEFRLTGILPKRVPPSVDNYIQHCGGLYDTYMLRHCGPPDNGWERGKSIYQPRPKAWHGDPMLALHKGFKAISGHRHILPGLLETLDTLYENNDEGLPQDPTASHQQHDGDDNGADFDTNGHDANHAVAPPTPDRSTTGDSRGNSKGRGNLSAARGGRGRGGHNKVHKHGAWGTKSRNLHQTTAEMLAVKRIKVPISPWKWGPHKSSNDQVDIYNDYMAGMRAAGYLKRSEVSTSKKKRWAKNNKTTHPTGTSLPEECDEVNERVLSGVGIEGVKEWLSNTS